MALFSYYAFTAAFITLGIALLFMVVAFAALVALNSLGVIPPDVTKLGADISQWCLIAAVAALGTKTRLRELADIGFKPVALMAGETVFLAALVVVLLHLKF